MGTRKSCAFEVAFCLILIFCFVQVANATSIWDKTITLTCPYWNAKVDAAGYGDFFEWGYSPYHPHAKHELLSGEWAAAIYYDGIDSANKAMWLTDYFIEPYWPTYNNFEVDVGPTRSDDPNNPVVGYDTGRSVIKSTDNEVEVTIDYEMVDLGEGQFSPLAYREGGGPVRIRRSERYVLLQTYTIKNIKPAGTITGLEFYQMLHSHGAGDYGPVVHCSYETLDFPDALENYTPYNDVHTVENFKYDITQWNNPDDPLSNPVPATSDLHADWVGFSCTVEPNVIDCNLFAGHYSGKPADGTHVHIEERNLNGQTYEYGETAGAMGWYLPDLEPGESNSITVAFMFGTTDWPIPTILTKTNADPNNECVYPWNFFEENYLTFDICYDANGYALDDALLIDYLPAEVDFNSCTGGGVYDGNDHTVTWEIGDVGENDSNCFEVVVEVNYRAAPCGVITNNVALDSEYAFYTQASGDVNVCNWGSDIIYVDKDANGFENGTSWDDAYTDLQDALRAARACGAGIKDIWVAAGTYKPTWDAETMTRDETFELIENVGLFGHFVGIGRYETSTNQRDFADANNETILEGQIGEGYYEAVKHVVSADGIEHSIVDGFTITGSADSSNGVGVYLDNAYISIVNCKIKNNRDYGIYAKNHSYPDIHNCTFIDNVDAGVYSSTSEPDISYCIFDGNSTTDEGLYLAAGSSIDVINSVFKNHDYDGIYGNTATLTVDNSTFKDNQYEGLYLASDVTTSLTNCSIETSGEHGVYTSNSDLTMEYCLVDRSADNGLHMVSWSNLTLEKCVIRYSGLEGLELSQNSSTAITNCWIHNNGTAGIYFDRAVETPEVRNNTIYGNYTYGIEVSELGADPNILNCIIYANDSNDLHRENEDFEKVNYCCLQNVRAGAGNITGDPGFMNIVTDPNDLHLDETSQCKDAGDLNGDYGDETDIDGEERIRYERVDMGADEYYWSDADFDEDGIVNFIDYAIFAAAWRSEPNDVNYNAVCDLQDNNNIDFNDLVLFCDDWLWKKAWGEGSMMYMGGGDEGFVVEGMIFESAFGIEAVGLESAEAVPTGRKDDLMLSSAIESLAARPERLTAKSEKFYAVNAFNTVSALRKMEEPKKEIEEVDVKKLLDWLAEIWLDPKVRKSVDAEDWLKLYQSLKEQE